MCGENKITNFKLLWFYHLAAINYIYFLLKENEKTQSFIPRKD